VIADPDFPALNNPAAYASAPFGREGAFETPMRRLHQMAGLGLLRDFQDQISDPQLSSLARGRDPFDKKVGTAHHPGQRDAKLTAGAFPALPEKHRHLTARFSAARVAFYAVRGAYLGLRNFDQGRPKGGRTGYSQQNSHIFTSTKLKLVMNYTFVS
jgi:hypothetical protein